MIQRVLSPPATWFRPSATGVRAVLVLLLFVSPWSGCVPVGVPAPSRTPEVEAPAVPSIETGTLPPSAATEGALLLQAASDSLEMGELEGARRSAERVIQYYPSTPGSGDALRVLGRALLDLGFYEEAEEASVLYLDLFDPSHPRFPAALLLLGQVLAASGDWEGTMETLLDLPAGVPATVTDPARVLFREALEADDRRNLGDLAEGIPEGHPLRSVLASEYAVSLSLLGEAGPAMDWARIALASDPGDREEELAQAVLRDDLEEILGRPLVLGAILPLSEVSPGLLQYSEWISEGIQVAIEEFRSDLRRPIQLETMDDGGIPLGGISSVRDLESAGASALIGPLTRNVLAEAAAARTGGLPIISPSAFLPVEEADGVFSLSGPDPGGARMVAKYAWDLGLERVVVLRPRTAESRVDAGAFLEEFQGLGGTIPREIVYDSGATFFQEPFDEVGSLVPDGLFLPLSPRDIELLAPQFTYYGLDTLGIQLLGTSGWATDEVVLQVDSRHTDGVIASTTRISQDETEASLQFRRAYEDLFQKSLRSEVPALGHDAAALFFQASRNGPRTPEDLLAALEEIRDFPGATGRLTIDGGLVTREPHLVRIQNQELIYISSRFD